MTNVIPFFGTEDFAVRIAFALWAFDRFHGDQPLTELGSWARTKDRYLERGQWVVDELDRPQPGPTAA